MTIIFDVDRSSSTQVTPKVQPPVATEVRTPAKRNPIEDALRAELGVSRPSRSAAFHWADIVSMNIEKLEGKLAFLMANKPFENAAPIKVVKSMLDAWKAIPPELVREMVMPVPEPPGPLKSSASLESQLRALTGCKRPSAQTATHYREFVAEQIERLNMFLKAATWDDMALNALAGEWRDEWAAIPADKLVDGQKHLPRTSASPGDSGGPMNAASVNYSRFPLVTFMSERNIAFLSRDWPLANELDVDILKDAETSARAMMKRIDAAGLELFGSANVAFIAYTDGALSFADAKLCSAYAQWEKYAAFLTKRIAFRAKEDEKRSKLDFNLDGRGNSGGSAASRARKAAISSRDAAIRAGLKGGAGKGKK